MKSEGELKVELRYWEGRLKGLKASGRAPQEKVVEAKIWVNSLRWVLADSTGEGG